MTVAAQVDAQQVFWKRPHILYPGMVVLLLAIPIFANFYLMFRAKADPAFFVEKDYYKKAVAWDGTQAERRASDQLGWQLRLGPAGQQAMTLPLGQPLRIVVQDRAGQPVANAEVGVLAFHNARAGQQWTATATTDATGAANLALGWHKPGLHELQLRVTRGNDVFLQTVQRDVVQ